MFRSDRIALAAFVVFMCGSIYKFVFGASIEAQISSLLFCIFLVLLAIFKILQETRDNQPKS